MNREFQTSLVRSVRAELDKRFDRVEPRLKALEDRKIAPPEKGDPGKDADEKLICERLEDSIKKQVETRMEELRALIPAPQPAVDWQEKMTKEVAQPFVLELVRLLDETEA